MVNQENIEALFDCFDESATLLYKTYKTSYLDGLVITCENIMSNSVESKYSDIKTDLEGFIHQISEIDFHKEEIRKAFQYAVLKGFKHANISNQMITPDTLGIFINYLMEKLYLKKDLVVLDPLLGTGNLLTTFANHTQKNVTLIGVDFDQNSCHLASAVFDMLGYGDKVFFQDTMSFRYNDVDAIISDFSGMETSQVYDIIGHHGHNIKEGGFLIAIVDNDSITPEVLIEQAKILSESWKLFGLISLPSQLVRNQNKSIVIFQKNGEEVITPKSFLLADLPDFTEQNAMEQVISRLNDWFKNTEFYRL